jgi:hypothetical protein
VMGERNEMTMPSTSRPNFRSLVPPRCIPEADRLRRMENRKFEDEEARKCAGCLLML